MKTYKIGIIGLGLIGGSLSLALRKKNLVDSIVGFDINKEHENIALERGIIDAKKNMPELINYSDIVIISVPADVAPKVIKQVLDKTNNQIVMDVGSVKKELSQKIDNHPKRNYFISTHPMWGTEFSGPQNAIENSFIGKKVVFCDVEKSNQKKIQVVKKIFSSIGMEKVEMSSEEQDMHTAYVSHISHLVSFVLSLAVLEKEKKDKDKIFMLASAGFESTVRLAKSSASMWAPIFVENQENILKVLDEVNFFLNQFREAMRNKDSKTVQSLINQANAVKKILDK